MNFPPASHGWLRAGAHRDDFVLDETTAEAYFDGFEPRTTEEGPLTVCHVPA